MKKYISKLELKKGIKLLKNKTALVVITSTIIIVSIVGCDKKEDKSANTYIETTTEDIQNTTEMTTEVTTEYIETTEMTTEATTEQIETTEMTTETTTQENTDNKSKDEIVTEFFDEQKKELNEYIESNDVENIKAKGKDIFTTFVDFIFYEGEIKGIKYDELSEGIKKQLYEDFCNIDTLVSNYSPNYKDDLADKYYKVKDYVSPKYYETKDKIIEYIGTENMDKLDSIKENSKDVGEDLWNKSKEKIKQKYENWRDE